MLADYGIENAGAGSAMHIFSEWFEFVLDTKINKIDIV